MAHDSLRRSWKRIEFYLGDFTINSM